MPSKRLTVVGVERESAALSGKRKEIFDTDCKGLVLRVTDKRAKSWSVYYYDGAGKHRRYTLGRFPDMGLNDAREMAREAQSAVKRSLAPDYYEQQRIRERKQLQARTFGVLAERFMEGPGAKLRTKNEMQRQLDRDVLPHWNEWALADITRADVRDLIGRRNGVYAANRTLALVRRMLNWAVDMDLLESSPAARVKAEKEAARERVLTDDELRRIWSALNMLGNPHSALFKLLILTGQRRGEVGGMRWSEIGGKKWTLPGDRAKNEQGHLVYLAPKAIEIMETADRFAGCPFVFTTNGRTSPSGWSKTKKRLDTIIAEQAAAGEPVHFEAHGITDWRWHDLRRTFATGLRSLGFDRLLVSQCLNHTEGPGATKIYDRFADDAGKRRAWEAWAAHVEKITGGDSGSNVVKMTR